MRKFLSLAFFISLTLYFACQPDSSPTTTSVDPWQGSEARPHNPWVFRSVLDTQARMITLALSDKLWVAYSAESCALYKAWSGGVDFDGAVYTTAHGPQPVSIGDAWVVNEFEQPWFIVKNGTEQPVRAAYKGHRLKDGKAELLFDLPLEDGNIIRINERPEYLASDKGFPGFERVFTLENVPEGIEVGLKINISSVAVPERINTDGKWTILNSSPREYNKVRGTDVTGKLLLNSTKPTRFATTFLAKPTIENPNKPDPSKLDETPAGERLIARSGCRACHNTYRKTVGPSYIDVAKRYPNTEENVATLVNKVVMGGKGNWGEAIMNPHPHLAKADIKTMIEYIMALDADTEKNTGNTAAEDLDYVNGQKDLDAGNLLPGVIAEVLHF